MVKLLKKKKCTDSAGWCLLLPWVGISRISLPQSWVGYPGSMYWDWRMLTGLN